MPSNPPAHLATITQLTLQLVTKKCTLSIKWVSVDIIANIGCCGEGWETEEVVEDGLWDY